MIKMAKEAERKAKLAKDKGPNKVAKIDISTKWINWLLVALLGFQVFLNIAAYNAMLSGMNNINLYLTGFILIVFAGMFHLYRYGMAKTKEAPPPPPKAIARDRPKKELEEKLVAGELPDKTSSGEKI
jgi:ubiquinol-cytochrome c reductase cytochrome b subunit